eukprot:scaffold163775_cov32-Tisochrysis_lutea.AAC.1
MTGGRALGNEGPPSPPTRLHSVDSTMHALGTGLDSRGCASGLRALVTCGVGEVDLCEAVIVGL